MDEYKEQFLSNAEGSAARAAVKRLTRAIEQQLRVIETTINAPDW